MSSLSESQIATSISRPRLTKKKCLLSLEKKREKKFNTVVHFAPVGLTRATSTRGIWPRSVRGLAARAATLGEAFTFLHAPRRDRARILCTWVGVRRY